MCQNFESSTYLKVISVSMYGWARQLLCRQNCMVCLMGARSQRMPLPNASINGFGTTIYNFTTGQQHCVQTMQKAAMTSSFCWQQHSVYADGGSILDGNVMTLQAMTHHVRMALRDSKMNVSQKQWDNPVAGIAQGNLAGPQIWAAVTTLLFELMHADGFVSTICCMISQYTKALTRFAFVDNTYLCISGISLLPPSTMALMQQLVTQWEGALVPKKNFWYLYEFE